MCWFLTGNIILWMWVKLGGWDSDVPMWSLDRFLPLQKALNEGLHASTVLQSKSCPRLSLKLRNPMGSNHINCAMWKGEETFPFNSGQYVLQGKEFWCRVWRIPYGVSEVAILKTPWYLATPVYARKKSHSIWDFEM